MQICEQRIVTFETADGKQPFVEWVESLRDKRAAQRVFARIARVRSGNFGDAKGVGDGVIELRINYGPGYRIYCGRMGAAVVILLGGGDKTSQVFDIRIAKRYWGEFRKRRDYNGY